MTTTTSEITLRLDLVPARVVLNENGVETVWEKARLYVAADSVHIWSDTATGPAEVFSARLEDFTGKPTTGYTAQLTNGRTLSAQRATGCLCGSRLRGIRPWTTVKQMPINY